MLELKSCPKYAPDTGIRIKPPEETLREVLPKLGIAGLGEPEDITSKDDIGIPVFSVDRQKTALGKPKYYNGKGVTKEQAEASAVMESIERYSAERQDSDEVAYGTYEQACDVMLTVNPADLILPIWALDKLQGAEIAWTPGWEMFRGEQIWVPACAVFYPYKPDTDLQLFKFHTNGIASGNTMEEAVLHAMFELIERDAWSIADYRNTVVPDVEVDPDSVPGQLLAKFAAKGVDIHLKDLTSDIGVPTIGAAADDTVTKDPELLTIGVGTHLNPEIAAIRAITEVAQSRATHKDGKKINAQLQRVTNEMGYERIKEVNRMWYTRSERTVKLSDMRDESTDDVLKDIEVVLGKLVDAGFDSVIAVDITRPELGVPSVRMVIPFMEVWTMDEERVGPRLRGMWPPAQ
ncbi:MAG: YcaO-related McrA-glycine thioamidation protein [Thermoplasmata archaeon]|nr:YcaO-related McrA-glycine thioamidation protein [Thermoplasmata archaeon]